MTDSRDKRTAFYKSKKWRDLLTMIKMERTNSLGLNSCEKCGKPMVGRKSAIGHHVIELTEENVDDVTISLNQDNVELVCHQCHNDIHNRFGAQHKPKSVYLVYGAPSSGKLDWVAQNATQHDLVVEIDRLHNAISTNPLHIKSKSLNSAVFKLREQLYDIIKYRAGDWQNAYIVATLPYVGDRERLAIELNITDTIYIESTIEECFNNVDNDDEIINKGEIKRFINQWFEDYTE